MSKLFEGIPQTRVVPNPDAPPQAIPGTLAQGDAWALFDRGGQFVLEYMSGEVSGRGVGSVVVTPEEASRLRSADEAIVTSILNAHGRY